MTKEELVAMKKDKEALREKIQATFHQISGQLIFIDELLFKLEKEEAASKQ